MIYEGREQEYIKRISQIIKTTTLSRADAIKQAMREFGFIDRIQEKYLYESWRKHCSLFREKSTLSEAKEVRRIEDFETAIRRLPVRCTPEEYWNWIGAHPALSRKARQSDKTKELVLTVEDIHDCSHGPAPSQEAVHALQFYANNVGKYYEYRDAYMKKAKTGSSEADKTVEKDLGIEDIKALIGDMGD